MMADMYPLDRTIPTTAGSFIKMAAMTSLCVILIYCITEISTRRKNFETQHQISTETNDVR